MTNAYVYIGGGAGILEGKITQGDPAIFTCLSDNSGTWPATTALAILGDDGIEHSFPASITGSLATWLIPAAEASALIGTRSVGSSLDARITVGTGDTLNGVKAGRLSILSKWHGVRSAQSLGTVTLGPPGPGVASAAIVDGALVLTLDNGSEIAPVALPLTAVLAEDGTAPGLYHMGVGTTYALTLTDDDLYSMTPLTTTLGVI